MLVGGILMLGSGIVLYKLYKRYKTPVRYSPAAPVTDARQQSRETGAASPETRWGGRAAQGQQEGFKIFVASNLDRIFKDGKTLLKPHVTEAASLSLAKNEYESFQIVVQNGGNPLTGVILEPGDLLCDQTGEKIRKDNIAWNVVGYVPTKKPYYTVKYVGPWSDPLMPPRATDVNSGETQPFWVTVYAPAETPAGIYHGQIRVTAANIKSHDIPVTVRVYNFSLPKESHLKTAFDLYPNMIELRYPKDKRESPGDYELRKEALKDKFTIAMLKHRMNPVLNVNPTVETELGKVDRYRLFGLNNFSVGRRGGSFNNNWPDDDAALEKLLLDYRTYGEVLALNRMLGFHYIYTWDEGRMGNPQVPKVASMIHRAHPKLKNMVCYHGFWDPAEDHDWGKDIDIWCFQISSFDERKMSALKERGMEIWMYVSGPGDDGAPNLAVDFDSIDYRIIPWICGKYGIRGFLYWNVIWWPEVDPFVSAANTEWQQNGNGLLMYPGVDGPIVSLRMAIFRDGMEDYEYLHALREQVGLLEKNGLAATYADLYQKARQLVTVNPDIVVSPKSFTKDGEQLKQHRDALAETIEKLRAVLNP